MRYRPEALRKQEGAKSFIPLRKRGKAEGHMGELKDVLAPALSSTNQPGEIALARQEAEVHDPCGGRLRLK